MKVREIKEEGVIFLRAMVKSSVVKHTSRTGSPYLEVLLVDNTGDIILRVWDISDDDVNNLEVGKVYDFHDVKAQIFKGRITLSMNCLKCDPVLDYDVTDYSLTVIPDEDQMTWNLVAHVNKIQDKDIKEMCKALMDVDEFKSKFYTHPAAEHNHHAEAHGLLFHTTRMMDVADKLCDVYKDVDRDIVIASILFHDVGKLQELEMNAAGAGSYTRMAMLGHIYIGASMVEDFYKKGMISMEQYLMITHCILSHHGKKEWGSPVEPMTQEALIVHMVDNLDAQVNKMENQFLHMEDGEFSGRVYKHPDGSAV